MFTKRDNAQWRFIYVFFYFVVLFLFNFSSQLQLPHVPSLYVCFAACLFSNSCHAAILQIN